MVLSILLAFIRNVPTLPFVITIALCLLPLLAVKSLLLHIVVPATTHLSLIDASYLHGTYLVLLTHGTSIRLGFPILNTKTQYGNKITWENRIQRKPERE